MTSIVTFTGGKRCVECEDQISPKRLQANPGARLCTQCQEGRDMAMCKAVNQVDQCGRNRQTVQSRHSITIKW